jgi:hypothetical protein
MKEQTSTVFRRHGLHDPAISPALQADFIERAFEDAGRSRVMIAHAATGQDDGTSEAVDHTQAFRNDPSRTINSRRALAQRVFVSKAGAGT